MTSRAVFLDRDNTLVQDPGYLSDPSAVRLLDGVAEGLALLSAHGFRLVVVTNQAGVAKGYFSEDDARAVNETMVQQLAIQGVSIDAVYYCPCHPDGVVEPYNRNDTNRKPSPGMLLRAARELDIDLAQSWMIGDSVSDAEAGKRAGCRTIIITLASSHSSGKSIWADYLCSGMKEAGDVVIRSDSAARIAQ
jgi:D-glycero-D-manno-heptose 1,7-bisphosphate phosphatase